MSTQTHSQTLCIYQPGKPYIETASKETPPRNLDGETFDVILARLNSNLREGEPAFQILTIDEAADQIEEISLAQYCGPWKEIDEETWWDALGVLPPEKWQTVGGVELFRMMEYLTGSITAHYARLDSRYFTRNASTATPYAQLAAEVAAL
jgi:hypothetical protein